MSKTIINFDNQHQRSLYTDFAANLAFECFHELMDMKTKNEPGFDATKYKKKLISEWFSLQKKICNNEVNTFSNSALAHSMPVEEMQVNVNKSLTTVKSLIDKILLG